MSAIGRVNPVFQYHMVKYERIPAGPVGSGTEVEKKRRGEMEVVRGFTAPYLVQGSDVRLDWVEVVGVRAGAAKEAYATPTTNAGSFSVMV